MVERTCVDLLEHVENVVPLYRCGSCSHLFEAHPERPARFCSQCGAANVAAHSVVIRRLDDIMDRLDSLEVQVATIEGNTG